MRTRRPRAGRRLRKLRESLSLSIHQVAALSARLARQRRNPDLEIGISALSDAERKGKVPNIYRLCALAAIYERPLSGLLLWYGVEVSPGQPAIEEDQKTKRS